MYSLCDSKYKICHCRCFIPKIMDVLCKKKKLLRVFVIIARYTILSFSKIQELMDELKRDVKNARNEAKQTALMASSN